MTTPFTNFPIPTVPFDPINQLDGGANANSTTFWRGDGIWAVPPGSGGGGGRPLLNATTNFYITTTGNDSNPGTIGSPWLTLQHANDYIATLDLNGQTVVVNVGAGTFAGVALTPMTGGGQVVYLGTSWNPPLTTLTASPVGDGCVEVAGSSLGSTAVTIANVILAPGGSGAYCVAVFRDCQIRLGQDLTGNYGAGVVYGSITSGSAIGIYGEGLCSITDGGGDTAISVGSTPFLAFMFLTGGAVYRKYGNWIFNNTVAASNGLLYLDTNSVFLNIDGDTFYTNGPILPGAIPFHLRTGAVIEGEEDYFGDVTYGIVESGTFHWALSDPLQIPTDPATKSIQTPSTGFNIAFPESTYALILKPAGTLATGAIALPNLNYNGKRVIIKSTQQVTSLAIAAPVSGGSAVASGSYNSGTGQVTLTLGVPLFQFYGNPGQSITVSGITGTGSVASVNGTFTADAGTSASGLTVKYTIASGLTLTITPATGNAASKPDTFGSPGTISAGGQIEAVFDLATNAWYL